MVAFLQWIEQNPHDNNPTMYCWFFSVETCNTWWWGVSTHKCTKTTTKCWHLTTWMAAASPYASNTHPIEVTSGSNESHWSPLSTDRRGSGTSDSCGHPNGRRSRCINATSFQWRCIKRIDNSYVELNTYLNQARILLFHSISNDP